MEFLFAMILVLWSLTAEVCGISTATLIITKPYVTTYYGDTINFTCQVVIDKSMNNEFLAIEFVMAQKDYTLYAYEYGRVCYAGSSRYRWPGLAQSHRMCNPVNINSGGHGNLTLPITITEDMHTASGQSVHYQCVLYYTRRSLTSLYRTITYQADSPFISLPISNINKQSIHIQGPKLAENEQSVTLMCTSTNSHARLEFKFVPPVISDIKELSRGLSSSLSKVEVQFTVKSNTRNLECTDGGRRVENKTFVRYSILPSSMRTSTLAERISAPGAVITTKTPISVNISTRIDYTEPLFTGQNFKVICGVVFSQVPISLQYIRLTRMNRSAGQREAVEQCPPLDDSYWLTGQHDRLEGRVSCDNFYEELPMATSYTLNVSILASEALTMSEFQYKCSVKYNRRPRESFNSYQMQPIIYHLGARLQLSLPATVMIGERAVVICSYNSTQLPSVPQIRLVLYKQNSGGYEMLSQESLQSNRSNIARSQVTAEEAGEETLRCALINVPEQALQPQSVTKTLRKVQAVPEGIISISMILKPSDSPNKSYLEYGQAAIFKCSAELSKPVTNYEGLTLRLNSSGNTHYEDGCLNQLLIPASQKFLQGNTKQCPTFSSSQTNYTAIVTFNVTSELVAWHEYQCVFHYDGRIVLSEKIVKLGIRKPLIRLQPRNIDVFEGQHMNIDCTSTNGFPQGQIFVTIGNTTKQSPLPITDQISQLFQTRLLFTSNYNGLRIVCTDSKHPDVIEQSAKIKVKYIKTLHNATVGFLLDISKDTKIDCNKSVYSNTRLTFKWIGAIIFSRQQNQSEVDIIYSTGRGGGVISLTCQASMLGDPHQKIVSVKYFLNFVATHEPPKILTPETIIGTISVIIVVVLLIVGFALAAVIREWRRRKKVKPEIMPIVSIHTGEKRRSAIRWNKKLEENIDYK